MKPLIIATRGSPLALWQAEAVRARLELQNPGLSLEIQIVKTQGDRNTALPIVALSMTGVFTREVDERVISGKADLAVHSLKDQTTTLPHGLAYAVVLERGPVQDAVISRSGANLRGLKEGARVATGSLRRRAQLLRLRPDLIPVEIRGNVETRLAKLADGEADALLLASAGLQRLGLSERITEILDENDFVPAVSQGIVGVTFRAGDPVVEGVLGAAVSPDAFAAAEAERGFLRRLGGGCNVAAGALALIDCHRIRMRARVLSPDGAEECNGTCEGRVEDAANLGDQLAEELIVRGARKLLEKARG